jgi:integrase
MQARLGHAFAMMTLGTYTHVTDAADQAPAAAAIERLLHEDAN